MWMYNGRWAESSIIKSEIAHHERDLVNMKRPRPSFVVGICSFLLSLSFISCLVLLPVGGTSADNGAAGSSHSNVYLDSVSRNIGANCMEDTVPSLITSDRLLISYSRDLKTNKQFDLEWKQLCSATKYELQISTDRQFARLITLAPDGASTTVSDSGSIPQGFDADKTSNPTAHIAEGMLPQTGAIYWWRVRACETADGQLRSSPWSESRSFTLKAWPLGGASSYEVEPMQPGNGTIGLYGDNLSFSWTQWYGANKYQLEVASDVFFRHIVLTAMSPATAYRYTGNLEPARLYYWHVRALEVNRRSMPSDWSTTFHFTTGPARLTPQLPPPSVSQGAVIPAWRDIASAIGIGIVIGLGIVGLAILIIRRTKQIATKLPRGRA
jgi:hypothetical protein